MHPTWSRVSSRLIPSLRFGCVLLLLLLLSTVARSPAQSPTPPTRLLIGHLNWALPDSCLFLDGMYTEHPTGLDDIGSFEYGDTVAAFGTDVIMLPNLLCSVEWWLSNSTVAPPHQPIDLGCGVLNDHDCAFVDSFIYGTVSLNTRGGFAYGDTVHVVGQYDERWHCEVGGSFTHIPFLVLSITACSDTNTVTTRATWGRVRALYR